MTGSRTAGDIPEGATVYGADGEKVGTVVAVGANHLVVEKGFFFPTDYFVPFSVVVGRVGDDGVVLSVTREVVLSQDWDSVPGTAGAAPADAPAGPRPGPEVPPG